MPPLTCPNGHAMDEGYFECPACGAYRPSVHGLCAWDLIGYDGGDYLRIVGGRALYETAIYYDDTPGEYVRLARVDTQNGLRQVNRYVHPKTPMELVSA